MYINEIALIILIFLAGLSVVRLCLTSAAPVFSAIVAFPLGLIVWSFCHLLVYFSPFPAHPPIPFTIMDAHATLILFGGVIALLGGISLYRAKLVKKEFLAYGGALITLVGSDMLLTQFPVFVLTGDSYQMLQFDHALSHSLQGGFPIFNQTLQSLSLMISYDYIFMSLYQLVAICLAALMSYLTFGEVRRHAPGTWMGYRVLVASAPPALLFSTYIGLWQAFYLNHHVLVATYILIFGGSCWLARVDACQKGLYVGEIALLAFMLSRMEGLLCAATILPIFLSDPHIPLSYQRKVSLAFALASVPWYLYVIRTLGTSWKIGDSSQHLMILAFTLATALIFQANRWHMGQRLLPSLRYLIPIAVGFGLLLTLRLTTKHMLFNVDVILNMLLNDTRGGWDNPINLRANLHGGWGNLWYFIAGTTMLVMGLRPRKPRAYFIDAFFLAGISLIGVMLDIIYFTNSYITALEGSINRMMFHVAPLLLVWAVSQLHYFTCWSLKRNDFGINATETGRALEENA